MKKISKELKDWVDHASTRDAIRVIVTCDEGHSKLPEPLKPLGSFDTILSGELTRAQIKSLIDNTEVLSIEMDKENFAL